MEYRRLGKSGLQVSLFSFGSWVTFSTQMGGKLASDCMALAYENGINFFDNAEVYADGESEKLMGQVLKDMGWSRDTYCVSSKVFWGGERPTQMGLSRKHVFDACHAALKRLQVDYLDMYLCHRPDIDTPIEETVWAMNDLMRQGKILYWGTSEWSSQQITEAFVVARANHLVGPTMEQPQYNLFHRERVESEYLPLYRDYGLGTTIWSPLASGLLSGKYANGIPADARVNLPGYEWLKKMITSPQGLLQIEKTKQLAKLAQEIELTSATMAIAWCAKNPNVSTVILGASKVEQLRENLKALEALPKLTPDVMERIEQIVQNKPTPDKSFKS